MLSIVFVIFLLAIFSALLTALPSLLGSKNRPEKTLYALKWRLSLSIILLCMVLTGAYFGAWRPNGIAVV